MRRLVRLCVGYAATLVSPMICIFSSLLRNGYCLRCGYRLRHDYKTPPRRRCRLPSEATFRCAFFGEPTGDMQKTVCSGKRTIPEHRCWHPERTITTRKKGVVYGRCTQTQTCVDAGIGIIACIHCPLRVEQKLLAAPTIKRCVDCPDNPNKKPAPAEAEAGNQ